MHSERHLQFAMVRSTMQQICDDQRIMLSVRLVPGYRDERGQPWSGRAQPQLREIEMIADPYAASPQSLWWTFCHELSHVLHGHLPPMWNTHLRVVGDEIEAWKTAERIASYSAWPPDERFYQQRRYCLGTYGVAA